MAYATFVKSDDGIPSHGNLSSVYDDYASKILAAQNATLEYQDEMKVLDSEKHGLITIFVHIHTDVFFTQVVEGEVKFENDEHKNQYDGLPDEVWDGQQE